MKTLKLTSPHLRGQDVELAQALLTRGKGGFGNFHPGKVDGNYGENTASATRRAKYALGYPQKKVDGSFGDILAGFLSGKRKLPLTYRIRRKRRLTPAPHTLGAKALASAAKQIGVKESPAGSNQVLFSHWYGLVGPWCAEFLSWNYVAAGSKSFKAGSHYAYCPYILADAKSGRNGLRIVDATNVQPGDIVLYCWDKSGVPEHTGLFERWTDSQRQNFSAVEGNTAVGSDSNGGEVMRRDRNRSLVVAFVRVMN